MVRMAVPIALLLSASAVTFAPKTARAQEPGVWDGYEGDPAAQPMQADYAEPMDAEQGAPPPIPPYVEGPAVATAGGGYCFEGPHPVDSRVEPGVTWDNTPGRHLHGYPPFDLRLFSLQNGCYYFIGDPTDFGYAGASYSYYGAHPILAAYGGGWCFMIGPHRHVWRPWSPLFVTVGSWYYWQGPYDPFFWTYWPYYHFYYRSHYPHYYGHGAFFRSHMVAPRITHVPRPVRGIGGFRAGNGYRAAPMSPRVGAPRPGMRAAPFAPHAGRPGPGNFRAAPAVPRGAAPGAFRAAPAVPRGAAPGAFRAAPAVPRGAAPGAFRAAPSVPRSGPPAGAFRAAPSAPSGGGFAPRHFSAPSPRVGGGGGAHFGGGHFGGRGRR
jgi:hypothetical protein